MLKFLFLLLLLVNSHDAFAWGPATHLFFGLDILDRLPSLIPAMQAVLGANPMAYLYGCVSADIVLAKKFGKAATHCHRWDNGMRLLEAADSDRQQAFALGYLSHLAADTQSHNCYVPSKYVESAGSKGILNHMIWELRFDKAIVTPEIMKLFNILAYEENIDCDEVFQKVIKTRVLDFSFNKKIFNQLMILQGVESWQVMLATLNKNKEQPLKEETVHMFTQRSRTAIIDFLNGGMSSQVVSADPIGEERQRMANAFRRTIQKSSKKTPHEKLVLLAQEFYKTPHEKIHEHILSVHA